MLSLLLLPASAILVGLWIRYRKRVKAISDQPGLKPLFSPMSSIGFALPSLSVFLPREWIVSMGYDFAWRRKYEIFAKLKSDVISVVPLLGGRPILYLADAELIQKINLDRHTFPKPVEEYTVLSYFGPNLVTSEGQSWRRQQRITIPAFNSASYALLWDETRHIVNDMIITEEWSRRTEQGGSIQLSHVVEITLQLALLAIARAGFGIDMRWSDNPEFGVHTNSASIPKEMSMQQALHIVAQESVLKLVVPSWMAYLPIRRLRLMRRAFAELDGHIKRLIHERKLALSQAEEEPRSDLFTNLIRASLQDKEEGGLSDDELVGNIYMFLLAGHETTAHTLAFTFALLALYPDEQEALYRHIIGTMPEGGHTTIDDYKRFNRVRAVYLEALRLFPPIQAIPKVVNQDTILLVDETNQYNTEIGKATSRLSNRTVGYGTDAGGLVDDPNSETPSLTRASSASSFDLSPTPPDRFPSLASVASLMFEKDLEAQNKTPSTSFNSFSETKSVGEVEPLVPEPRKKQLVVEKGTIVFIDPPAVHYNPKYYPDPHTFRPDRFMGDYNKAAFLPFSTGTRACIGRHFSEVESVCVLVHILSEYSVHPVFKPGESHAQLRERLSRASTRITLSPKEIPVVFKRRS